MKEGDLLHYPSVIQARSVITSPGSGEIPLPVGTQIMEPAGIESGNTIDSEVEEAYYGDMLKNEQMTGEFPVLGRGNTADSRTGNVSRVSIVPEADIAIERELKPEFFRFRRAVRMGPINYAIVLYMDDDKTTMVKEWIKELAPVCGNNYCLTTVPHITISAIIADDEETVKEEAEKLSKILKKGEIKVGVIGVFIPHVLFLSPVVDSFLIESSQKANEHMLRVSEIGNQGRYIPNNWVPHMAVAMKMNKEGLCKSFEKMSEIFTPFCAEIDKLALIKWEEDNPYQELAVYDLK